MGVDMLSDHARVLNYHIALRGLRTVLLLLLSLYL